MTNPIPLPAYPASRGPIAARQLENSRERYRKKITEIEAELAKVETEFAKAFDALDQHHNTRDRIAALAQRTNR